MKNYSLQKLQNHDIPELANKNLQAFFTTNMATYPEEGQMLTKNIVEDTMFNIHNLFRQQLQKEIDSDKTLNRLEQLFKVFIDQ